jgi:uncharacterized protein involved in outer membrane biogenesis
MPPAERWSNLRNRARRAAERGRVQWRRTRARLERLVTPPPSRPAPAPSADGTLAVEPLHHGHALRWLLAILTVLVVAIIVLIAIWDWNWFRGPLARYASVQTHRSVRIDGDLRVKLLTWTPEAQVDKLKVGNPAWAGKGDTGQVERLRVQVKLLPLLVGRVEMPLLQLDQANLKLIRDASGRANWQLDPNEKDTPTRLPPIQRVVIKDGKIDFRDVRRRLSLTGTVQSSEELTADGKASFNLLGEGQLNDAPFHLRVTGGPLIQVRRDRPYNFDADLRAGSTRVLAAGSITRPFDFGQYQAKLTVSGSDLANLYNLTGLTFPNTPPYRTTGHFVHAGDVYRYEKFNGRVGDSDLSGDVEVSKRDDRRFLKANLVSRSLDMDDLAALVGGSPSTGKGETVSPEQAAMAGQMRAHGRMMPDAPLRVERLRSMDADVAFRATAVKANALRLTAVKLGAKLDHGVLKLDPFSFGFAQGAWTALCASMPARTFRRPT